MISVTEQVITILIFSFLHKPPFNIKAKRIRQKRKASPSGHFIKVYRKAYPLQNPCFGELFHVKLTSMRQNRK